jgi:hypothetical protein
MRNEEFTKKNGPKTTVRKIQSKSSQKRKASTQVPHYAVAADELLTRRRLVEIQWMFRQGVEYSLLGSPRAGQISLALFFAAAEQLISLVYNDLGYFKPNDYSSTWLHKFDLLKEKGHLEENLHRVYRKQIGKVAGLRNSVLHGGARYHSHDVAEAKILVEEFLSTFTTKYFGLDFEQLSDIELIEDQWVKQTLLDAARFASNGVKDEALNRLMILILLYKCELRTRFLWEFRSGPQGRSLQDPIKDLRENVDALAEHLTNELLKDFVSAKDVERFLRLGVNTFHKAMPGLSQNGEYKTSVSFPADLSQEDLDFLVSFTTALAVEFEARGIPIVHWGQRRYIPREDRAPTMITKGVFVPGPPGLQRPTLASNKRDASPQP